MEQKSPKGQKRRVTIPLSAFIIYLLLIAVSLSGVTFSKYVTGTTVGDTARVALMKNMTLSDTGNFTEQNKWIITPGVNMTKNVTVHFDGSEMACYVFVRIKTTGWEQKGEYAYACPIDGGDALTWSVDDAAWTFLSTDGGDAVYYGIVRANTPLDAAVLGGDGTITVSKDLTRTQLEKLTADLATDLSIDIEATVMQYHGVEEIMEPEYDEQERALAAWNIVKSR